MTSQRRACYLSWRVLRTGVSALSCPVVAAMVQNRERAFLRSSHPQDHCRFTWTRSLTISEMLIFAMRIFSGVHKCGVNVYSALIYSCR